MIETKLGKTPLGTAVVTGASAGIGRIYADRLAQRGYDLLLVARRADRLEDVASRLKANYGVSVRTMTADLASAPDLEAVAETIAADAAIMVLVNNAGTSTLAPLAATAASAARAMTV